MQIEIRPGSQGLEDISSWLVKKIAYYARMVASEVDVSASFASYGLSSTDAAGVSGELEEWLGRKLPPTLLYSYPTIDLLARALSAPTLPEPQPEKQAPVQHVAQTHDIAVIGMAGRFPGASNVDEFWQNLRAGVESITFFTPEELILAGGDAEEVHDPTYVPARPVLKPEEVEHFDAAFFGYSPHEAALTDPQHRLFLECAWEALESAGYDASTYDGLIGVYGGCSLSTYLMALVATEHIQDLNDYQIVIGHDKDSLTSTVSYKLNLKGPSFAVQTFCSTSLVAICLACQSLQQGESDIALAGGVSVRVPSKAGYHYQEGGMESQDGHCRTFDSQATGTPFGDGAGVVVLKRLPDALRDGDTIDAVIKGSAINNDGSLKVSYTAPSIAGQTAAITRALTQAGVDASTISYVEAHGSATELGDPIEVTALTNAFRQQTTLQNYCGIGSVKTNIGHLDRAAGVAGLIKVVQALKHKELPPTLHVQKPNPKLVLEQSPFFLNTQLTPWQPEQGSRRASVNSLGLGGTNAHVILEEAPELPETSTSRPWQLLMLSARTESALNTATRNLQQYLQEHEQISLADVAYTLQVGRKKFEQRRFLLCRDRQDAVDQLSMTDPSRIFDLAQRRSTYQAMFLFPGVGEQYPGMTWELYEQEPFFRDEIDRCCQMLHLPLGQDLRQLLYPEAESPVTASSPSSIANGHAAVSTQVDLRSLLKRNSATPAHTTALTKTELAQPALFVVEYALARLLMHWGIQPQAMLGYSLGEYVAATLSGVLSLEDALMLVVYRARLIAAQSAGAMLSVAMSEVETLAYLQVYDQLEVDLAVVAAPQTCVLAGSVAMIERMEELLEHADIACYRIDTTHAFHSRLLLPAQKQLTRLVKGMALQAPAIPYISNVTGTWITDEQATSPEYWARHMCETVRFSNGVGCLLQKSPHLLVEVGIGQALGSFVRQHPACDRERMAKIFAIQPTRTGDAEGYSFFLTNLGRLWLAGATLDWKNFYENEQRQRIPLPTYPFERLRCWVDVKDWRQSSSASRQIASAPVADLRTPFAVKECKANMSDWFSVPGWKQAPPVPAISNKNATATRWLILQDEIGIGATLAQHFSAAGQQVVTVSAGMGFAATEGTGYQINPRCQEDYQRLFQELAKQQLLPTRILHAWSITHPAPALVDTKRVQDHLDLGFYSLLALAQALDEAKLEHCTISILANGIYDVLGQEQLIPEKATLLGPCQVIPQEYPSLSCHLIEIALSASHADREQRTVLDQLAQELRREPGERIVALRGARRWLPTFEALALQEQKQPSSALRKHGVYLLTGGLGGIGLSLAAELAKTVQARLVLTSREGLPPRATWPEFLQGTAGDAIIRQRIAAIQALELQGAEVLVLAADVANQAQMQAVLEQTRATFGELNGVLHLAGIPGTGLIQFTTPEAAAQVLAPKVQGTLLLEQLLQGSSLDFFVLFSSITAVTGGPGQADYSAASAFLDAFARSRSSQLYPIIATDWSEWQWNGNLAGYNEAMRAFSEKNRSAFGISFAEGAEVLQRILGQSLPQVIVSTQDIQTQVAFSATGTIHTQFSLEQQKQLGRTHTRPTLSTSYVAPRDDNERKMVRIWEEVLAIDGIGIYDNFFDLGGNPLLGGNLLLHVRRHFNNAHLPAHILYEAPSVEAMTRSLTQEKAVAVVETLDERSYKRQSLLKKRMRDKNA